MNGYDFIVLQHETEASVLNMKDLSRTILSLPELLQLQSSYKVMSVVDWMRLCKFDHPWLNLYMNNDTITLHVKEYNCLAHIQIGTTFPLENNVLVNGVSCWGAFFYAILIDFCREADGLYVFQFKCHDSSLFVKVTPDREVCAKATESYRKFEYYPAFNGKWMPVPAWDVKQYFLVQSGKKL